MDQKAAETTCHINISSAFGPGTAIERTVQWWFKKFCKRDESLEDEEHSGQPSKGDNQLRVSLKLIVLKLHEKLLKNSLLTIPSTVVWHLKQIEKVKKFSKGVPYELTENQKNHLFEVSSLILCNNETFLDPIVIFDQKCILYDSQQ